MKLYKPINISSSSFTLWGKIQPSYPSYSTGKVISSDLLIRVDSKNYTIKGSDIAYFKVYSPRLKAIGYSPETLISQIEECNNRHHNI